jgi:hypothetical protein
MNKRLFIAVFLLGFCRFVYSQTTLFTPEWAFGVNGGATFSKVSFNSAYHIPEELLQQYSGGLTIRYISENHFGIQGELNYSLRGWQEGTDSVHIDKYTLSLAYLELPVLTHIYFNMGKRARIIFNLGPQLGYNIGQKTLEKEVSPLSEEIPPYYDMEIDRKFDYGLKFGMGLEIRTGAGSFILDGRYYYGLSDIFNNKRTDIFQSSSNQIIGVNLTYLFRLTKGPFQSSR